MIKKQDYSNYKHFGHLTVIPEDVLRNLSDYYDKVNKQTPNLFSSDYTQLPNYTQWHIQTSNPPNQVSDYEWIHWNDDDQLLITKNFFRNFVKDIIRFRFSLLDKTHIVDYHFKHFLPRIHIPLNNSDSIFVIRDETGEYFYPTEYGNAYFVNVTLDHKVVPTKSVDRKNSFFCFTEFVDDVVDRFKK